MKLTVLGCYGTFPGTNGACSGYLVQDEGVNILIDCGNGVISRAQRYCKIEDINAIVLSHLHLDHMADAFVLKYAIETKMAKGQKIDRIKLFLPGSPWESIGELYDSNVFDIVKINEGLEVSVVGLYLSFVGMRHLIESYAVVIKKEEKKFVYSGDTGFNGELGKAAENADIFLCESTFLESEGKCQFDHHLSAAMAGRIAAGAKVKKLLLTHFWYEEDKEKYLFEARKYFENVYLAKELSIYDICM